MKRIITRLRLEIDLNKTNGNASDDVDWVDKVGVLITQNDAEKILEMLESESKVVKNSSGTATECLPPQGGGTTAQ